MNNVNFTDWQDLWLKKDIERILKKMNSFTGFSLSVIINLIIVTFTLVFTAIPVIKQGSEMIPLIIILAVLSVFAPLFIALVYYNNNRKDSENYRERNDGNNSRRKWISVKVREYVDTFDNKICNSVMMAASLFEHMKAETDFTAKYYYICQINYYINRCIEGLYPMITESVRKAVFIDGEKGCVSPNRLRLVLKLLYTLRKKTYEEMKSIKDKSKCEYDEYVEKYINKEANEYDTRIMSFIDDFNNDNNDILLKWDVSYRKTS